MATKKDLPQWVLNKYKRDQVYHKQFLRQIKINLNKKTEQDMIDYLDSLPSKSEYIKNLIRKDMTRGKKNGD